MCELLARSTNLPQAFIRLPPSVLEEIEEGALHTPGVVRFVQPGAPCEVQYIYDLAVNVQLALQVGRVSDPHRRGIFVARQPSKFEFRQTPLSRHAIHDLKFRSRARDRSKQPFAPCGGLLAIAADDQPVKRKGSVAQPAVAIIPVTHAPIRSGSDVVGAAMIPPVGW